MVEIHNFIYAMILLVFMFIVVVDSWSWGLTTECVTELDCYKKYRLPAEKKMKCIRGSCYRVRE
ncbi:putative Late nodulin [Medicago truncatula]|uniref:Late nodulin n=1 Tax=Medicago truncatula TaxID=3880 RepID=G7L694_MEDTR|nr:late nodulin [Medicago truncatula]RHN45106.1 putative Late nodulin [Medicago truncatula]